MNRKDPEGRNLFAGGFLGMDNIGVFDRSQPLPTGGHLEQADGTAWMAFYCSTMLSMALELASEDPAYEDLASKFFEHFVAIADAMNTSAAPDSGEEDGFYYDQLHVDEPAHPAPHALHGGRSCRSSRWRCSTRSKFAHLEGFQAAMDWFLSNRQDLARSIACMRPREEYGHVKRLLAHPDAGAPGSRAALPARRERVPVPARHPLRVAGSTASTPTLST